MRPLRIAITAAANAAVFGLYLLFFWMIGKYESVLPAVIVPTLIFLPVAALTGIKLVHILPAYAAVTGHTIWKIIGKSGEMSVPMLLIFTGLFLILQLTVLLMSGIVKANIRSIREEIAGSGDDDE